MLRPAALLVLGAALLTGPDASSAGGLAVPSTGTIGTSGYFLSCRGTSSLPRATSYYDQQNQLKKWDCGAGKRPHKGVDIHGAKLPGVTPVFASAPGTVKSMLRGSGLGWAIVLNHGRDVGSNGRHTFTVYAHMGHCATGASLIAPGLAPGAKVSAGQLLGYQGDDGYPSGCAGRVHLHWEIRVSDAPVSNAFLATTAGPNFYTGLALTADDPAKAASVRAPFTAAPGTPPSATPTATRTPVLKPAPAAKPAPTLAPAPAPVPVPGQGRRVRAPGRSFSFRSGSRS